MNEYHRFITHEYLDEEPVSEDLEKEIQEYYDSHREYSGKYNAVIPVYKHQLSDIARHFANWQKQQDKQWLAEEHKNIFAKGRESMKQQMMKNAKELVVDELDWHIYNFALGCLGVAEGDRVKVIVIKEE